MAEAQSTISDNTPTERPSPEQTQPPNLNNSETSGPPPPLPGNEAPHAAEASEDGPGQEPKPGTTRSENERFGTRTPPPPLPNAPLVGNGVEQPAGPENDGPRQGMNPDTDEDCDACTARISRCEQYELEVIKLQRDAKELKKMGRKVVKTNKHIIGLLKQKLEESKENAESESDTEVPYAEVQ